MSDEVVLKITLEGETPGLSEHRLSLNAFAKAFSYLLIAYRRIASGLIMEAIGRPGYGGRGGGYAKEAQALDLEIITVTHNSPTAIHLAATMRSQATELATLFQSEFVSRAGVALLDSIEAESRGDLRSINARRFLHALPAGIRRQQYDLAIGDRQVRSVHVESIELPTIPEPLPFLVKSEGSITGLGFEPGKNEIRFKSHSDGQEFQLSATPEQVNKALSLRGQTVTIMILKGKTRKLLWLKPSEPEPMSRTHDQKVAYILGKWGAVLRKFAE